MPIILAFVCVVFAVYKRSLGFQFILDDHRFTSDPRIQESGHIWEYFSNYVWAQFVGGPLSFYRPMFVVWVRISYLFANLSSWGWHFLSIAKHVVVAGLLGVLVWRLLRDWVVALAVATVFALHPAQTESVSWVTVPDPLMTAWLLGAILLYLQYVGFGLANRPVEKKSRKKLASAVSQPSPLWLLASSCAYFAALLTKETAVVFLAVIFATALCIAPAVNSKSGTRADTTEFGPRLGRALRHSALFACLTVLCILLRFNALGGKLGSTTQHLPWRTVVLSWPAILCFYFKVMFWPVRSYAFADPILIDHFSAHAVLFPLLLLACLGVIVALFFGWTWRKADEQADVWRSRATKIALVIGTLLLILPLLPVLDLNALNPGDFLHGRYTYLPLAGLMLLIATAWHFLEKFKLVLLCAAGVMVVIFATLTFSQETQWKDDATVFATAHQLAPHNAPVAQNLANTQVTAAMLLQDEGRCREAVPMLDKVLRDYPEDWLAWAGLGVCYVQLNDLPKAEASLHRAADISRKPQVIQQWQELRAHMGLPTPGSTN